MYIDYNMQIGKHHVESTEEWSKTKTTENAQL